MSETYRITIVESITYKQFVGIVGGKTRQDAEQKAEQIFISEYPLYSAHCKVIMSSKILKY